MNVVKSAISMAEGNPKYKMDVSLIFGGNEERHYVLRTCLDSLTVWKTKYIDVNMAPFEARGHSTSKEAAIIEQEVWVFGIDSTISSDIEAAIKIAADWYGILPKDLMRNIYVKNLNAEREDMLAKSALIEANKGLYQGVCMATQTAARALSVSGELNFWVMSNNVNPKIPKAELHQALRAAGAIGTATARKKYRYISGSNDGTDERMLITHLHLAKFVI